jgi:hypothetical protein
MSNGSDNYVYSVMPGARLYVGPKGKLEESLGHSDGGKPCCSGCASGKKTCGGAGALGVTAMSLIPAQLSPNPAAYTLPPNSGGLSSLTSSLPSWAPFAVGGIALFVIIKMLRRRQNPRRRRRNPSRKR